MAKREHLFQIKPPPNLNKELLGVWNAWNRMGDKEVVREAAVKGHHIEFAYKFLAARGELDVKNVQQWFKDEVFIWISELLHRQQIFKASHIISNINLDAIEEFTKIFLETPNATLRDYLGNHLLKSERLSSNDKETWKLLQIVLEKQEFLIHFTLNISNLTIKYFNEQSHDWKCEIGTQLYFKSFDDKIRSFVTAETAWNFLLRDNNIDLLILWINIYFSQTTNFKFFTTTKNYEALSNMFLNFQITEHMIDVIESIINSELRDNVLNELSKFGVFVRSERDSLIPVLKRLTHTESIDSVYTILSNSHSTITLTQFYRILVEHCVKNDLHLILNWCNVDLNLVDNSHYNSKHLDLLLYLGSKSNLENETGVGDNIFKIAQFLSDDLGQYLESNPLILLATILFLRPDIQLQDLFSINAPINFGNFELTPNVINSALVKLPFLHALTKKPVSDPISFYDLLQKHLQLKTDIFKFQWENTDPPHFNSSSLQTYAYKKKTNYIFLIKQARPCFASKLYLSNECNSSQSLTKLGINRKILKVFFRDITNIELAVSCIAFLEMIGDNSSSLRIYVKVAQLLLDSNIYSFLQIQNMLLGIFQNPEHVLGIVEDVLMRTCSLNQNSPRDELLDQIKKQEIAIKLTELHNYKLPERFLKYCAHNNFWFPFLIFIQTYNYPITQVQKLLQEFQSVSLRQHLYHGISNEIQIGSQKELLMRDSRNFYLSRIGVRKNIDLSSDSMYSSASSYGSTGSSSTNSDFLDSEGSDFETDMLHILVKCHNSIDPPKALLQTCFVYKSPIFAVLASSYEPDSFLTHWLMWLTVSCGNDGEISNFEVATNDARIVGDLLISTIKMGYCRVLHDSFQIFLPDNPLCVFVDFLRNCIDLNFDISIQEKKLDLFSTEVKRRKISTPVVQVDYEMLYLSNKLWIEATALSLLAATLQYNFTSYYHQLTCMKFLHDIKLKKYFNVDVPDFLKYYNILSTLFDSNNDINFDLSVIFTNHDIENEILSIVHKLVAAQLYSHAYEIAKLQGICTDFIVIDEWYHKFKRHTNHKEFWEECSKALDLQNVDGETGLSLFEKCCSESNYATEQYIILDLAYDWASSRNLDKVYDLETRMWVAYFSIETKHDCKIKEIGSKRLLYGELKQLLLKLVDESLHILNESKIAHLNATIEKLLDLGDFWQAFRLTKIFNYKHIDVDILELCYNLAEGFVMPYQLSAEQRLLLIKHSQTRTLSNRRRRTLMSSKGFSSFSSASHSPMTAIIPPITDHVEVPFHDTLVILETLQERIKNGQKIIQDILKTYRIAINTERSYQEIFKCNDSTTLLKEVLYEDCCNKLEVIHDTILLFQWSNEKVADFLSEQLIETISDHIKANNEPVILWNINLDTDFNLILQLLIENCSILGLKLCSEASALKSELDFNKKLNMQDLSLIIELLIRSHDCFTSDCNMEGISIILRKCQSIVLLLLNLNSWKLIVRLLTGVARYTEMNYVFHILRQYDQFEFLLRKGCCKDNGLKVALLKYLKTYCPEDRELFRMVALHFILFSEIAQLWEEEAKSIKRNLIAISKLEMQNNGLNIESEPFVLLTNTDGTKICLNKAMINYTHAAEYHLQGEKLTKAMYAAKQAELLALQISMLKGLANNSTTICILNITDEQILTLISTELSFAQSLILIDSNNYKPDWSMVLFKQYIMQDQCSYFDNFLASFPLSDSLLHDLTRKFLNLSNPSGSAIKNMKDAVNRCASIRVKYRIASELNFTDLVEELLASNQLAYLKDTVWKKGYRT